MGGCAREGAGRVPGGRETLAFVFVCAAVLGVWQLHWGEPEAPVADARRYLAYVANLVEFGVFSVDIPSAGATLPPGRANTPLYPAFVAGVYRLADTPVAALRCHQRGDASSCPDIMGPVVAAQLVLAGFSLWCIWMTAWHVIGARGGAWAAPACALLSGQLTYFANRLLTENLSIAGWALLTLLLCRAGDGRPRRYALLGLTLGLLSLTRPEFLYLAHIASALLVVAVWRCRSRPRPWPRAACLVLGIAVVVAPWMARNHTRFGDWALTDSYAGPVLAQRVAYNRMSLPELGVAFIYWLPDFGDSLAKRLFPEQRYRRLDFGPDSYYQAGDAYHAALLAQVGRDAVPGTILRNDILAHPLRHGLVTLALAWRGVFVAKLWGLLGLAAWAGVLLARRPERRALSCVSAPAWFMLFLYAAVSVSIPRYAVCFIPTFSLALAIAVHASVAALRQR